MTAMGRKPLDEPRNHRLATYVTASEAEAVRQLVAESAARIPHSYPGTADVLRRGLALLIEIKHPELMKNLRKDLDTTL